MQESEQVDEPAAEVEELDGDVVTVDVAVTVEAVAEVVTGRKGVPASKVKFVLHWSIVNCPEPEQVNAVLWSEPGQRLMLLKEFLFTMSLR